MDTAHAYVTATTVREPLYVMATRGRESNRLYVDTAFDPDAATSHGEGVHADPGEILQSAITTSGADLSATETRRVEEAAARSPWRIEAQGAAALAALRAPGQSMQAEPVALSVPDGRIRT